MGQQSGYGGAPHRVVADRYQLVGRIGAGGMGTVYEAEDLMLERRVAVKIMHSLPLREEAPSVARFRREAQAMARIRHPSVAVVHDLGFVEGAPYIVMELLDGFDLHTLVTEHGPLAPELVRGVATSMCAGLSAAHRGGVLHRDLKPGNVHTTRAGRVVLQDFGLARLIEQPVITALGQLVGTPQYMAPEAIRGERTGIQADLYGVGACMYFMLTGEPPLGAAADIGVLVERAVDRGVMRLVGNRPEIPEDLATVVDRLTSPTAMERPGTAEEVIRLLGSTGEGWKGRLVDLVLASDHDRAVDSLLVPPVLEAPEYLDGLPQPQGSPARDPHGFLPASRYTSDRPTLSNATMQTMMASMTAETAASRLREAVNLVLRGDHHEAVGMLGVITKVCSLNLGPDDPTTVTSQFWHAVCLSKLGAGAEALPLFAHVSHATEGKGQLRHATA